MRKQYEVTYTVTYRILVDARTAAEAKEKASLAESWEWNDDDSTEYQVEETYDEE